MSTFGFDNRGAPILLAAVVVEPAKPQPDPEPDLARGSAARRRDAVVDAARTLDDLTPAGVESFVRRRWRGDRQVTSEDFDSFAADAREQRKHDIVDAIDHRIRQAVHGRAGAKQTHVSLPRGIGAKSLGALEVEELTEVVSRLRDRGWSDREIRRHGVRRLDKQNKTRDLLGGDQ